MYHMWVKASVWLWHVFDWEGVNILDKEKVIGRRLISGMIYINLLVNPIDTKDDINKPNEKYSNFLYIYFSSLTSSWYQGPDAKISVIIYMIVLHNDN